MKLDRLVWQMALRLWENRDKREIGSSREWLSDAINRASGIKLSDRTAGDILFALENMDIINNKTESIPVKNNDIQLVIADLHCPFHDQDAIKSTIKTAKNYDITIVSFLGDVMDLYGSSSFRKNPKKMCTLSQEFTIAYDILCMFRDAFPDAYFEYLEGNHERRFMSKVDTHLPEAHDDLENFIPLKLNLSKLNIDYKTKYFTRGQLWHMHGDELKLSSGAVNIAKLLCERTNKNVISGHYHTSQNYIKKGIDDSIIGGWSIGHLASKKAFEDYRPVNNWVQGFAIVSYEESGDFTVQNKMIANGKVF